MIGRIFCVKVLNLRTTSPSRNVWRPSLEKRRLLPFCVRRSLSRKTMMTNRFSRFPYQSPFLQCGVTTHPHGLRRDCHRRSFSNNKRTVLFEKNSRLLHIREISRSSRAKTTHPNRLMLYFRIHFHQETSSRGSATAFTSKHKPTLASRP